MMALRLRLSENGSWALVNARPFFCGSLIRGDTGSFKNVQKCFDLLVEVGHMTNDGFAAVVNFLGPIF